MKNIYRDKMCGTVSEEDIDKKITLSGWIENIRDHGGVKFLDLRDEAGYIQVVSNDENAFDNLTKESVIKVVGTIRKRNTDDYNEKISTGSIELLEEKIEVLGKSKNVLPFEIISSKESSEEVRLKYRYLDLRNKKVHDKMVLRSKMNQFLRKEMEELGHTEITTPILTASSPEGARDFIVPSRKYKGKFYALPQAPQIFKQLLMISGFDKYFQIAPCFRDEDARSDRVYGEFYQLDMEMAFATEDDILEVGQKVFYDTVKNFSDKKVSPLPFERISYRESMEKYGTDKPDLRNPLLIQDITDIFYDTSFKPFKGVKVRGIKVEGIGDKSNSWFNEIVDYATSIGMPGIGYITLQSDGTFKGPIDKFLSEEERDALIKELDMKKMDVLFFIADRKLSLKYAGQMRTMIGEKLGLIDKDMFNFCIVKDFPMYEYKEEDEKYDFCHNPFSMPKGGLDVLENESIENIDAYQFDFVCNGVEMASGAIRNHDLQIMKKAFELVGYNEQTIEDKFKSLYTAFQYGAPPHGGMALGIDRLLMLILDEESIRETIVFPLTANGTDAMMGCPSEITEHQLRETHIKIRD